jgi:hypothetical protein
MALINLKSNLANFRSEFTTPSVASQTVNNLGQPSKSHINKASNSNLDIDSIPASYNRKTNFSKSFINTSLFDRADDFILKYTGRTGFTQNVINTSKFNIDTIPTKFSIQGMYTPSVFNTNTKVNKSKFNIDTLPSKFSISTKYTPTNFYPDAKVPNTSARWKGSTPPAVNFFADAKSGAKGFSTKFTDVNQTKFVGATKTSYTYPNLLGLGDRLVSRPLTNSKFPNSGTATLANQLPAGSVFHYAKDGVVVSKKFSTQGYSESRKYGDNIKSIKGQSDKSLLFTRSTERNSPSAIDLQYSKFSLRDEAHNTTYMPQPFVLRGIQRKGKETPQYWGFGSRAGFDDGLIQGGIVTVADRVVADTVRIAKWMASPKGLLWIVKQVGLGLTNPKVESIGGPLSRQTRIHTGVTSLLSVVGSPFGLHFTRHGLPFLNEAASYENVQRTKKLVFSIAPGASNRLLGLRNELGLNSNTGISLIQKGMPILSLSGLAGPQSVYGIGLTTIRRSVKSIEGGYEAILERREINPFTKLRNYAGKKAGYQTSIVFGIDGYKRGINYFRPDLETISTNLFTNIIIKGPSTSAKDYNANPYKPNIDDNESKTLIDSKNYSTSLYVGALRAKTGHDFDANKDQASVKVSDLAEKGLGSTTYVNDIETSEKRANKYPGTPVGDINSYVTLAYGKIPKKSAGTVPNDFRSNIATTADSLSVSEASQLGLGNVEDNNYYKNNNLETKYGFGNLGQVGADRTAPNKFAAKGTEFGKNRAVIVTNDKQFRGDKVNALDVNLTDGIATDDIYSKTGKDLIKFYFQDGAVGSTGNIAVMAFRATMTGFTDSFAPGWDRIDIMGRPDGAYLYNSFERNVSFNFMVAALSRSEMIPMWRKLNYLASYTMPDFKGNSKPSGPFMRITIGDLFHQTPGFITSLSYTIPDDATWDIAEDYDTNPDAKQLPMVVEASISFTIVGDYRPQMHGRVYSLSPKGTRVKGTPGQWLGDSSAAK